MASIANDSNGRRRILFMASDGNRNTIRLGKCDRKSAENIRVHVEALVTAKFGGHGPQKETTVWLKGVSDSLKEKLAAAGLIETSKQRSLGEFVRSYILTRPDVKPGTLEAWRQALRTMTEFFGDDRSLRKITPGEADEYKAWLATQDLAGATIAKRLSFARGFLHVARKHKLIDENPFAEMRIPSANVSARQRFIDRDATQRLLDLANPMWRTIIALCRFGGLRCPSEVLSLEWRHIDWHRERITVPSPKTDRYDGKASREIPLFADLRPWLQEAFEVAKRGQTHVVSTEYLKAAQGPNGWRGCNLRTTFQKIVAKAGLEPWPRLFHNLRASAETELLETFPVHVVAGWMGHGAQVSLKHYAQTTDDHFERAAEGGAECGAQPAQNRAQRTAVGNVRVPRETPERFDDLGVAQNSATREGTELLQMIEVLGFEPSLHVLARHWERVANELGTRV